MSVVSFDYSRRSIAGRIQCVLREVSSRISSFYNANARGDRMTAQDLHDAIKAWNADPDRDEKPCPWSVEALEEFRQEAWEDGFDKAVERGK